MDVGSQISRFNSAIQTILLHIYDYLLSIVSVFVLALGVSWDRFYISRGLVRNYLSALDHGYQPRSYDDEQNVLLNVDKATLSGRTLTKLHTGVYHYLNIVATFKLFYFQDYIKSANPIVRWRPRDPRNQCAHRYGVEHSSLPGHGTASYRPDGTWAYSTSHQYYNMPSYIVFHLRY